MKGSYRLGTIKFTRKIGQLNVSILVNGGSSNSYLQPRIAQCLKLPVELVPSFKVLVGSGQTMAIEGIVRDLPVKMQGHNMVLHVYLLVKQVQI